MTKLLLRPGSRSIGGQGHIASNDDLPGIRLWGLRRRGTVTGGRGGTSESGPERPDQSEQWRKRWQEKGLQNDSLRHKAGSKWARGDLPLWIECGIIREEPRKCLERDGSFIIFPLPWLLTSLAPLTMIPTLMSASNTPQVYGPFTADLFPSRQPST